VDEEIENGTLVLAEIPKAEHNRLIQQVLEARELKKTGVWGTTMATLMDATQTAKSVQRGVSLSSHVSSFFVCMITYRRLLGNGPL
jgi:hypothetical protein